MTITIPEDHEVQPVDPADATDPVTCGSCGLTWDDAIVTGITPAPSARCPFEPFHEHVEASGRFTGIEGLEDEYPSGHGPLPTSQPSAWTVQATLTKDTDGWVGFRQVPTFVLPLLLGLVHEVDAERTARLVLDPFQEHGACLAVSVARVIS